MKYVMFWVEGQERYFPIIFGEQETHKVIADAIRRRMPGEAVSAGFCRISNNRWYTTPQKSESMNLGPHRTDAALLDGGGGFGPERGSG